MVTDSTCEPKPGSPSFFKVVRDPSASHLSLPIAFVKKYLGKIPKNPTLRTATGEHSWRLKIKRIGENYCFADGWEELAKDTQLGFKDILVFWLIDPSTFQVSFFDEHGCEKDLPLNEIDDDDDDDDDEDDDNDDDDDSVMRDENFYFQKIISEKTHRYSMVLPKNFVDDAGLENKKSIIMKDVEGKEWTIGLRAENYERLRLSLSRGWPFFRRHLDLSDGDMCLFKFIKKEGVLTIAQIVKSKKQETPAGTVPPVIERKPGGSGDVEVKVEYESGAEEQTVKKKRRRSPLQKGSGGDVEVKIEDELLPEVGGVKRKRQMPPVEKPLGGGGEVKVKIEDESGSVEVEVVESNRRRPPPPPLVKPSGGGEKRPPLVNYCGGDGGERPPFVKPSGGGGERPPFARPSGGGGVERPPFVRPSGGGGGESLPFVKPPGGGWERPPPVKPFGGGGERAPFVTPSGGGGERPPPPAKPFSGGGVRVEPETGKIFKINRVIYF